MSAAAGTAAPAALGPIDVVVIGYPADAPITGEAADVLVELVERGVIRVLDVKFVTRDAGGAVSGFDARGLSAAGVGSLTVFEGASSGLIGDEDVDLAAARLEPGRSAAIIVFENRWAAPFVAAVHRSGGELIGTARIPVDDLMAALDAAEAS